MVTPSAEIGTDAMPPLATPLPTCAPVREKWISFTPVPPGSLSVETSVAVTSVLFQPFVFGVGLGVAVVIGGVVSSNVICGGSIGGDPREGSLPKTSGEPPAGRTSIAKRKSPAGASVGIGLAELSSI